MLRPANCRRTNAKLYPVTTAPHESIASTSMNWATRRTCCVSLHKATNTLRNRRFGRLIGLCAEQRVDHAS
jgi:hypothetical protein